MLVRRSNSSGPRTEGAADISHPGPILVLAPVGRDAAEIGRVLDGIGVATEPYADFGALCDELRLHGDVVTSALVIAEEALACGPDALVATLARQPPWSDLPILVLTTGGRRQGSGGRWALFEGLGNVTLLDRPFHPEALWSAAQNALRSRARQFKTQRHLEALQLAAETLETRVEERTRALAEEAAERARAEASYRALYKQTPLPMHSLDTEGRLLSVSNRWLAFMGYDDRDEVIGHHITEFICAEGARLYRDVQWPRLLAEDGINDVEYRFIKRSGEVANVLVSARIERDGTGRFVRTMAALVDITARKRAEERLALEAAEREATQERLRQAQKMEAVGQLTGGVAHDFNNLLTVVLGSLALLRRRIPHDPALLRLVDAAEDASRRGAQVSAQLLSFSRRQPLQAVTVDAREVVQGISELLQRTVIGTAKLEISTPNEALPIHVDRNQLEMALLNLVVNARDASTAGSRIMVNVQRGPVDGTGSNVWLSVIDEGEGMSPEVLQRVFEPFFTTKPVGVGTGLGLSMVYGFVHQSGGGIDIESTPGKGTRVRLQLPADVPIVLAEEEKPEPKIRIGDGESILIVEDDTAVRRVAVGILEQLGYPIHEAESGDAALQMLQDGLEVDLLLTDVTMPGTLDGIALARLAHRLHPHLRILVTSGRLPEGIDLDAISAFGGAFVPKPYQAIDLALAVQSILDGGI